MSRHSYKWDIIHVQRGAAACGDQEPASRARHGSIATARGRYDFLPTVLPARTVRGDSVRPEGRPWDVTRGCRWAFE